MIDMHSHIIPSIDDGCDNISETLNSIKKAKECGITKIFATPHFVKGELNNYSEIVSMQVDSINNLLKIYGIDFEVLYGNEIRVCSDVVDILKDGRLCSLNNSRYILIEFCIEVMPTNVFNIIESILEAGYIPIIAHPERYEFVQKNIDEAIKYVEYGALLQLNITSLIGDYGAEAKSTACKLLKHNLIHLWGTDYHDYRNVYDSKKINESFSILKKLVGNEKCKLIRDINPECIYHDCDIKTSEIKYKVGLFS